MRTEGRKDSKTVVFVNFLELWLIDMCVVLKPFLYFYIFCSGCLFFSNVWFWVNGVF